MVNKRLPKAARWPTCIYIWYASWQPAEPAMMPVRVIPGFFLSVSCRKVHAPDLH